MNKECFSSLRSKYYFSTEYVRSIDLKISQNSQLNSRVRKDSNNTRALLCCLSYLLQTRTPTDLTEILRSCAQSQKTFRAVPQITPRPLRSTCFFIIHYSPSSYHLTLFASVTKSDFKETKKKRYKPNPSAYFGYFHICIFVKLLFCCVSGNRSQLNLLE